MLAAIHDPAAIARVLGAIGLSMALPNTPSLAGIVLHQQLVAIEVDISLSCVQNTSTKPLVGTIGIF